MTASASCRISPFPENRASLSLMARMGFKEIGVHEKYGKLEGMWKDCVNVERLILDPAGEDNVS